MNIKYLTRSLLATVLVALHAHAATLAPYQEAALKKMLSSMPEEQRAMVRPQLEKSIALLNKQQVDLMVKQFEQQNDGEAQEQASDAAVPAAEWGKAEADFDKAALAGQAYMDRLSDQRDAIAKHWDGVLAALRNEWMSAGANSFTEESGLQACEFELKVPKGRRDLAKYADAEARESFRQADRGTLRQMLETRIRYGNVEQLARTLHVPAASPDLDALRYDFAAPMGEAEVKAKFAAIDKDIAALLESSSRERHRIEMQGYADQRMGEVSAQKMRDLKALNERTAKTAKAICAPGYEAYRRGLLDFMVPLTAKVKPYVR